MRTLLPLCMLALLGLLPTPTASATTFVVDSVGDGADAAIGNGSCADSSGGCTLRAAIQEANAGFGIDVIEFAIGVNPGSGAPADIVLLNPLPVITGHLVLDGRTAPGYVEDPDTPSNAPPAVYIVGGFLGAAFPNADGLVFQGSSSDKFRFFLHAIGITGFPRHGIRVSNIRDSFISGCWIGADNPGGVSNSGNGGAGIVVAAGSENLLIGQRISSGMLQYAGNVIASNGGDGIQAGLASHITIGGNDIGIRPGLAAAVSGNGGRGVNLLVSDSTVGQFEAGVGSTGNFIANNGSDGIYSGAAVNVVDNTVFTNAGDGIKLGADDSQINANVVYANTGQGIRLGSAANAADNNHLNQNLIYGNQQAGIFVEQGKDNTLAGNTVIGNHNNGLRIDGNGNALTQNLIGIGKNMVDGSYYANGNTFNGIVVLGADNLIQQNTIGANDGDGIDVGANALRISIIGNEFGTTPRDSIPASMPNTGAGIWLRNGAVDARIEMNTILDSGTFGIQLDADSAEICRNHIAGSGGEGVFISATGHDNLIGSDIFDVSNTCANYIAGSGSDGIEIHGSSNLIIGNRIGVNGNGGVSIHQGGFGNSGANNAFANNAFASIRLGPTAGNGNFFLSSEFDDSATGMSIDLNDDGPTANDVQDNDSSGPNELMNFPLIDSIGAGVGEITVAYRVDAATWNAVYPLHVEFYLAADSDPDYWVNIGNDSYDQASNSQKTVVVPLPAGSPGAYQLRMLAIDNERNMSELGAAVGFNATPPTATLFKDGFE